MWVASKAPQHRLLHGTLVGVIAMLIYIGMTLGRPEPSAYLAAHALKFLGGAAGGFIAARRVPTVARSREGTGASPCN